MKLEAMPVVTLVTGRFNLAGQVSAEDPDEVCPTTYTPLHHS